MIMTLSENYPTDEPEADIQKSFGEGESSA